MLRLVYPFGAHKVEMERERAGGRWRTACCQLQPCRGDLPVLAAAAPVPRPGPGTVQGLQRHRGIEPERLGSTASAGSDGARSRAYRNRWSSLSYRCAYCGGRLYFWRAVDHYGEVLDMLVQRTLRSVAQRCLALGRGSIRHALPAMRRWSAAGVRLPGTCWKNRS